MLFFVQLADRTFSIAKGVLISYSPLKLLRNSPAVPGGGLQKTHLPQRADVCFNRTRPVKRDRALPTERRGQARTAMQFPARSLFLYSYVSCAMRREPPRGADNAPRGSAKQDGRYHPVKRSTKRAGLAAFTTTDQTSVSVQEVRTITVPKSERETLM